MTAWQNLNRERGRLIDRRIASTITELEQARLDGLNAMADAHIEAVAPRPTEVLEQLERSAVRCECDLLPSECLCARMREQVPMKCPLTWRVRRAWISWHEAGLIATRCAMWVAIGAHSHAHHGRRRYADSRAYKRLLGLHLGRAIAYEIAREHPMDRAGREIDDGLHDVMGKLEAM